MTVQPDSDLKHRHDIGHPDHGPETTTAVTRGIQLALGVAIFGTLVSVLYLLAAQA